MSNFVAHDANGDDYLSPEDINLWQLFWNTLLKFGCPVEFKIKPVNQAAKVSRHIRFYVPTTHPYCAEVVAYLQQELAPYVVSATPATASEDWQPGTSITVSEYSGICSEPYMDVATQREMARRAAENFRAMFGSNPHPSKVRRGPPLP